VQPPDGWEGDAYTGDGPAVNSHNDDISLDGMEVGQAKAAIIAWLADRGLGEGTVQYKLRDWLFSRQRYWGEPFPIVYDEAGMPIALPESMLPLELPEVDDYAPRVVEDYDETSEPEPPLGRATEWATVELDLGDGPKTYRRELNTMPQWAGSCWYEMRYLDPTNSQRFVDADVERYWMGPQAPGETGGVDLYVGGAEHAVLHLLYARFWHKVLHDLGHVSSEEPFRRLFNQGYIQAYAYKDAREMYVPAEEVVEAAGGYEWRGEPVTREYGKMGKSLKNVVTPDEMSAEYGADTFRLYEMSMGPLEVSRPWETRAVVGSYRFLQRVWRLVVDEQTGVVRVSEEEPDDETLRLLHRTIDGVRTDYAGLRFNTAVAKLIELNNHLVGAGRPAPRSVVEPLVLMMAPLVPHVAEELWSRLGHPESLTYEPFPEADPALLVEESVEYPVQVNGKVRGRVTVPADATEDEVSTAALAEPRVAALLEGREPRKVIVVPGRIVTVVV
jgi:leucyl-tRNA synthetase